MLEFLFRHLLDEVEAQKGSERTLEEVITDMIVSYNEGDDKYTSREVLIAISVCMAIGIELPPEARVFLSERLMKVGLGHSADEVFDLKKSGRPKSFKSQLRNFALASRTYFAMQDGKTLESACYDLAEEYSVSEHTVERAYKSYRTFVQDEKTGGLFALFIGLTPEKLNDLP